MAHHSQFSQRNAVRQSGIRRHRETYSRLRMERLEDRMLLTAYTFTKIADGSSDGVVSMNNHGVVAFEDDQGIYTGAGGSIRPIALISISGQIRRYRNPWINDFGLVAFDGMFVNQDPSDSNDGIYMSFGAKPNPTGNPPYLAPPAPTVIETNGTYFNFGRPALSNRGIGSLVYYARQQVGDFEVDVLRVRDGRVPSLSTLAEEVANPPETDTDSFISLGRNPVLNDHHELLFTAYSHKTDPNFPYTRHRVLAGPSNITIADNENGTFLGFELSGPGDSLAINNEGATAFGARVARVPLGADDALVRNGVVVVQTGSTLSGSTILGVGKPSMNAAGRLAFRLDLIDVGGSTPRDGIFVGPDLVNDKVIESGDTLFGSTVIGLSDPVINNCGQVAFPVYLEGGDSAIVRADPVGAICGSRIGDADADGVDDSIEDAAPNGGDGNNDGIRDADQDNVASLPGLSGGYATIDSPDGTVLADVHVSAKPSAAGAPAGTGFPLGFFSFRVTGVTPGGSADVTIHAHAGPAIASYWKFGPTPVNPQDHWYEFTSDGTTGAEVQSSQVTLHLVDGQRGDDDLSANGEIVEPGAPSVADSTSPTIQGVDLMRDAKGKKVTGLVLTFSEAMDPAGVQTIAGNYELATRSGRKTKPVVVASATYADGTVTLVPAKPIALKKLSRHVLTVRSTGTLADFAGHRLDGDSDGVEGGDLVLTGLNNSAIVAARRAVASFIDELLEQGEFV